MMLMFSVSLTGSCKCLTSLTIRTRTWPTTLLNAEQYHQRTKGYAEAFAQKVRSRAMDEASYTARVKLLALIGRGES